jgi:DtxR family transcriptional regulator, Mn-dependent transcriptional regulator
MEVYMNSNESMEMYLETIYILEKNYGHAHVSEVAERLEVSKPSVTKAVKQLKSQGLVNQEPYGSITLTEEGKTISKTIHKNHRLITLFLEDSLKLDVDEAEKNACKIEHILSDKMVIAIKEYLKANNIDFTE